MDLRPTVKWLLEPLEATGFFSGHTCLNRFKRQRNDTESGALLSSRTLELITWCHCSTACYVRVYVRMRVRVSMRMVVCTLTCACVCLYHHHHHYLLLLLLLLFLLLLLTWAGIEAGLSSASVRGRVLRPGYPAILRRA